MKFNSIQIRTKNPELGQTLALWFQDILEEVFYLDPACEIEIADFSGRGFFEVQKKAEHHYLILVSESATKLTPPAWRQLCRKAAVRIGVIRDSAAIDHLKVAERQIHLRRRLKEVLGGDYGMKKVRFLLRADDFPSPFEDSERFLKFHRILKERNLPYLLGVTPFLAHPGRGGKLTEAESQILQQCAAEGAEFALHGFTHARRMRGYASELRGMPRQELVNRINEALTYLNHLHLNMAGFIAPFNSYEPDTVSLIARYFSFFCGGPESVWSLGYQCGPRFLNGALYLPSYRYAYNLEGSDFDVIDSLKEGASGLVIPVALHWSNEVRDHFRNLNRLCARLEGHTLPWSAYVAEANRMKTASAEQV